MTKLMSRAFFLAITLVLASCHSPTEEDLIPNLGRIYSKSAQAHHQFSNPVIVIPGLLGSKLKDPVTGKSVWGVFDNDYLDLNRPQNFGIAALPMQQGVPVSRITPQAIPNGAITSLRFRAAGVPLQQQAYAGILKSLGVGGFRDADLSANEINWGEEHFTCFQFDYDWRLSNAQNAIALHRFIQKKKRYVRDQSRKIYGKDRPNVKFDIVAHSMGGLVARYYLRYGAQPLPADGSAPNLNWKGTRDVSQLIMVGTPNSGSIVPFTEILHGKTFVPEWKRRLLSIGLPNLSAAIIGTYPSVYEVLPRTRHQPLLNLADNKALDLYDHALWEQQNWGILNPSQDKVLASLLPEIKSPSERRSIASQHLKKCLASAAQFHRAIDRPATPPKNFRISLFTGDAIPMPRQIKIDLTSNKLSDNDYTAGDGSVLRSSALADERVGDNSRWASHLNSPIKFHRVIFFTKEHIELTRDANFTDNLLYQLLEEPR